MSSTAAPITLQALTREILLELAAARVPASLPGPIEPGALPPAFVAQRSLRGQEDGCAAPWCNTYLMRRGDQIVGGCGFKGEPVQGQVEIGYGVADTCRRQGVATAAVTQLLQLAFDAGASSVLAEVLPGNAASTGVVRQLGFRDSGRRIDEDGETVVRWVADAPATATGSCLCGAVQFTARLPALWAAHCHCTRCQRAHGAGFVTWVGTREAETVVTDPAAVLRWYRPNAPGAEGARAFCSQCGSPMFFKAERWPGELHVARALFNSPVRPAPQMHVFHDTQVPWVSLGDALPRPPNSEVT